MNHLKSNSHSTPLSLDWKTRLKSQKTYIVGLLLIALLIGAIPSYLKGLFWNKPLPVPNISEIQKIKKSGIPIQNWDSARQIEVTIGGHKWSAQSLESLEDPSQRPIILLLRPQPNNPKDEKPAVDWVDLKGFHSWTIDSSKVLNFSVEKDNQTFPVTAKFSKVRAKETLAVVQWYASDQGGNFSPIQWFWSDQMAQIQGKRLPWVAVSIQIPIPAKSELDSVESQATSIAQAVQLSLMENVFASSPSQ